MARFAVALSLFTEAKRSFIKVRAAAGRLPGHSYVFIRTASSGDLYDGFNEVKCFVGELMAHRIPLSSSGRIYVGRFL